MLNIQDVLQYKRDAPPYLGKGDIVLGGVIHRNHTTPMGLGSCEVRIIQYPSFSHQSPSPNLDTPAYLITPSHLEYCRDPSYSTASVDQFQAANQRVNSTFSQEWCYGFRFRAKISSSANSIVRTWFHFPLVWQRMSVEYFNLWVSMIHIEFAITHWLKTG
jgi:hypothetical protein